MERIVSVKLTDVQYDALKVTRRVKGYDAKQERSLVVYFYDRNGVPDRILSEFSCFRKECIRFGNGKYSMKLYYQSEDAKEVLIRLLSYGSLITLDEDDGAVLKMLKRRFEDQLVLSEIIKTNEITPNVKSKDDEEK